MALHSPSYAKILSILTSILLLLTPQESNSQNINTPSEELEIIIKKADSLVMSNQYQEAFDLYTTTIKSKSQSFDFSSAYLNRALSLIRMGKHDEALEDLNKVELILSEKDNTQKRAVLYMRYGRIYLENRNYDLSNKYYKKGAELTDIKESTRYILYYRLANNYKSLGNDSAFVYYWKIDNNSDKVSNRTYNNNLGAICGGYLKIAMADSIIANKNYKVEDSLEYYCNRYFNSTEDHKYYQSSFFLKKSKYSEYQEDWEISKVNSAQAIQYYLEHENDDEDYYNDLLVHNITLNLKANGDTLVQNQFTDFRNRSLELRKVATQVEKLRNELLVSKTEADLARQKSKNNKTLAILALAMATLIATLFVIRTITSKNKIISAKKRFLESENKRQEQELQLEKSEKERIRLSHDLTREENEIIKLKNQDLQSRLKSSEEKVESYKLDGSLATKLKHDANLETFLPTTDRKKTNITFKEIEYIKWDRNIAIVVTTKGNELYVRRNQKFFFEEILHRILFVKIHRSTIVNILHIREIKNDHIRMNQTGKNLPIGNTQKENIMKHIVDSGLISSDSIFL